MKKSIAMLFGVLSIATAANAQFSSEKIKGNGNVIKKNVTTPDYEKVVVSGFFDVDLVAGKEGKIAVEGEENLLQHLKIEVADNVLTIGTQKGKRISPSFGKKITITVPFESLNEVSLSGSGDVNSKSTIKSPEFRTTLSGSGDIQLSIDAQKTTAKVTGSGNMKLNGKSGDFSCDLTGSGDLDAFNLKSGNVDSSLTGSGNCKVYCTGFLQARITGSGDIDYKGDPKKKDTKVHGSGSISKA